MSIWSDTVIFRVKHDWMEHLIQLIHLMISNYIIHDTEQNSGPFINA